MTQASTPATYQQEFSDADWRVVDNADQTKKLAFQINGLTTATTRTATWPDKDGTVAMTSDIPAAAVAYTTIIKSANQTLTDTTTLTSDSELTFSMTANKRYNIRIRVGFQVTGANNTDFKYDISAPASPTSVIGRSRTIVGAGSTEVTTILTAYPSSTSLDGPTPGYGWIDLDFFVVNGANAGTFVFRFASVTNTGGTDTAVVLAGSTLEYATA